MARIRSIKPEFWTDEEFITEHTRDERMLYLALLNHVFDNWCGYYRPRSIKRECFPFDDDITTASIEAGMKALADRGRIAFFEHDGKPCFWLPNAHRHQVVNRPVPSPIEPPSSGITEDSLRTHGGLTEDSVNAHGGLTEDSLLERIGEDKERKGEDAREDAPPLSMSSFPPCMTKDAWKSAGEKEHSSSAAHILHALEAKRGGIVPPTDYGILTAAITSTCPEGCTEKDAFRCAQDAIDCINRANTTKTAAKWLRDNRGGA